MKKSVLTLAVIAAVFPGTVWADPPNSGGIHDPGFGNHTARNTGSGQTGTGGATQAENSGKVNAGHGKFSASTSPGGGKPVD